MKKILKIIGIVVGGFFLLLLLILTSIYLWSEYEDNRMRLVKAVLQSVIR